jgi:hypothetical protein
MEEVKKLMKKKRPERWAAKDSSPQIINVSADDENTILEEN